MADRFRSQNRPARDGFAAVRRLTRSALRRATAALTFERLWPALLVPGSVVALFFIASWLGLWLVLPPSLRIAIVALFVAAALAALWPLIRFRLPGAGLARRRVEQESRLAHRPLTALEDRLAATSGRDTGTERLWEAHRARTAAGISRLVAGMPRPGVAARDPYALRAAVLLVLIVAFVWAGPEWRARILSAFAPLESYEAEIARIDAWVSPPAYTGRAPLLLTENRDPSAPEATSHDGGAIVVPQGSVLVLRAPRTAPLSVTSAFADGEAAPVEPAAADGAGAAPAEYRIDLDTGGTVNVEVDDSPVYHWTFDVTADRPPSVALSGEPQTTPSRALQLTYSVEDDYGVVSADARFEPVDEALKVADPLIPAPDFALTLPQMRARSGSGRTTKDLTSHPWAGAPVRLRLVARDDAGQQGLSEPVEFRLPERVFTEELARAVIEQRRQLATDRSAARNVAMALDALSLAPEQYIEDVAVYIGLRSAYWRLRYAKGDDALRSVVDQLWEIALQIEDGDLSLAAEDLRAAQERLMQALQDDASDAEIEQLMAELRQAMQEFLREMARRGMSQEDMARMPIDPNAQMVTPDDLNRMLDAIENMARSGARDAARQMLSQLQNLFESLQAGRPMQGQMQAGPMGEMMNELSNMIRRQQELMDQTFEADRNRQGQRGQQGQQGRQGQQGQPGQQGQGGQPGQSDQLGQLGQGQGELRQALEELMRRMGELGVEPGNELGQAGEAMRGAEGALGQGRTGNALSQQGRALEALRRGSQSLAQQMMQPGQGYAEGQPGPGRQRTDPFGRPLRTEGPDYGLTVDVPDQIDVQRARKILEELRRRLSEPMRPRIERDYLERLLERF